MHKNIDNLEDTKLLATRLASNCRGGELIELVSDVGGGKTTFTSFFVAALGSTDKVSSPTFTVCKQYIAKKFTVFHYDFYRLNDPQYVVEAMQESLEDPLAISVVEWGGLVKDALSYIRLCITINKHPTDEYKRTVTLEYPKDLMYLTKGLE